MSEHTERTTVYIDVDDDITAIIGKISKAGSTRVALVVPKRSSVLQSLVNLKLIKKAAHAAGKEPVLISEDATVMRLAAGLHLHTAPNLKAEAAVPTAQKPAAGVLPSDTIEAETIGKPAEVAGAAKASDEETYQIPTTGEAKDEIPTKIGDEKPVAAVPAARDDARAGAAKAAKGSKIPDFNLFKKKMLLGIGGAIGLFLIIWFLFFKLPQANITIHGTTESLDAKFNFTLDTTAKKSNLEAALIPGTSQELSKTLTTDFTATGKKDKGTKATGTLSVKNCEDTLGRSFSAGTGFTSSSGKAFYSESGFSVPAGQFSNGGSSCDSSTVSVDVSAGAKGESYNIEATSYTSSKLSGDFTISGSAMSGGTSKIATVVSASDVAKAKAELLSDEKEASRKELGDKFASDDFIIESSFKAAVKSSEASPAVDEEASAPASLVLRVNYVAYAVKKTDLEELIKLKAPTSQNKQLGVINAGLDNAEFKPLSGNLKTAHDFEFSGEVQLGPNINLDELKTQLMGKNFSDSVEIVRALPGVTKADVDFSPFYVRKVPSKPERINIKIEVPGS